MSEPWWQRIEGEAQPVDADHWIGVYRELIRHFEELTKARHDRILRARGDELRQRLAYWQEVREEQQAGEAPAG